MANYQLSNRKKRGRQPTKLSVKLFLLDPEKEITKVTKETCSKENIIKLMQKGYGPPQPEHCTSDDKERVEFLFEQTNEQFKQKLVEIYPTLENACFVFLKADKNNVLEELNQGRCCYRCYTPENVYHSERGQGRLYIRKIAENQISQCTHGVPLIKRLCAGNNQQRFIPILPKQLPSGSTITGVETESRESVVTSVAMPTPSQLLVSSTPSLSGIPFLITSGATPVLDLSSSSITIQSNLPANISGIVAPQGQLRTSTNISATESTSPVHSSVNIPVSQLRPSISNLSQRSTSMPPVSSSINVATQGHQPISTSDISQTISTPPVPSSANMVTIPSAPWTSTFSMSSGSMPPINSSINVATQGRLPISVAHSNLEQFLWSPPAQANIEALSSVVTPIEGNLNMNPWQQQQSRETVFRMINEVSGLPDPAFEPHLQSNSNLLTLADMADIIEREQLGEGPSNTANSSDVQGNLILPATNELFLESLKRTEKLEISMDVLNNSNLLKKLSETSINILTVEIHSTCKLHKVVKDYSLPSSLKVLRITDNYLSCQDAFALGSSLSSVKGLDELDLSRTKFEESSFYTLVSILKECSNLKKLYLADNSLPEEELACFTAAFKSIKILTHLNLSKSNLTEKQASNVLKNFGEPESIDLSRNALQGTEIISRICQLQSLHELNLSHNHIRFFPLPKLDQQHDHFPINTQIISLSSNHMMPKDIAFFCSLIKSDLLKLNVDSNHVGNSIWALCCQRIKHLKTLNLANSNVCSPAAVEGLAFLLSIVKELEELDLSSNNLFLNDFQELQSPLSKLTQLKKLNLSNNPGGFSDFLQAVLPSLKHLEELRLSNIHLNGEDLGKISTSLGSLKCLKHLELSDNAIGPEGLEAIAGILKEVPLLERLDLSSSCVKEHDVSILCAGLTPLKNLTYLNLSGNRIAAEVLNDALILPSSLEEVIFSDVINGEKLFTSMKALKNLKKLNFVKVKLRLCDVEAIASMLSCFPLLEELALADVVFPECKWERIFGAIKLLRKIKKLHLRGLKIRDDKALVEMLSSLSCLEELVFSDVALTNMVGFLIALESLKCLKKLHLPEISFSKNSAEALVLVLPSLQLLEELKLRELSASSESEKQLFDAIGKLRYLKKLYLHSISITQTDAEAFAAVSPSLQLLEELVLEEVSDNSESQKQLFDAVGKLRYLKKLVLYFNRITKTGAEAFAAVLPSLQLLEELVLEELSDNSESQKQLFDAVGKLRYLKKLDLRWIDISITQTGAEALAAVLPSLQLLEELALGDLSDSSESQKQLFDAVGKLRYLKKLDLPWIDISITQTGEEAFAAVLPSLQLLEELLLGRLSDNSESQKQLFDAVGKLRYLKKLDLQLFNITQTGAEALAAVLPSLQLLEKLVLRGLSDNSESQKQLFDAVGKLRYLKKLDLQWLNVTQTGAEALAAALPSLQLLEELVLEQLFEYYESQKQLFEAVGKLRYLKKLDLKWFNITQTGAEALAAVLPSLQLLEELKLGELPDNSESQKQLSHAVGNLRYLKRLLLYRTLSTQSSIAALADALPSLLLLEELKVVGGNNDLLFDQVITALRSLRFLKKLDLVDTEISRTGAETLIAILPALHNLTSLDLPRRLRNPKCDEDRALRKQVEEAVDLRIP